MHRVPASRGFTLVEIMIALAVFAVVASALIKNTGMAARQTHTLQERTTAYWIAENRLNEMRLAAHSNDPKFPQIGSDRYSVTMANSDWEVRVDVSATENDLMHRIEVEVFPAEGRDEPLATLIGFVGRY